MEKALLNSDEEYFDLCMRGEICRIERNFSSTQYARIGGGVDCEFSRTYEKGSFGYVETRHVETKPEKYPCLFVWDFEDGDSDCVIGEFIYENDFIKE